MEPTATSALLRLARAGTPVLVLPVGPTGSVGTEPVRPGAPEEGDILLGVLGETLYYARPVGEDPSESTGFRETPTELVATAQALVQWHRTDPPCERCHGDTVPVDAGQRRQCTRCGSLLFFRTDPAVIVAITDDDGRLLLARQRTWPEGRVSVIAGFVEPGESLEQACAREVLEEVNLEITGARYFASQPWPYPRSLMVGFTARTGDPGALAVDGEEIVEASFLTKEELASRLAAGRIKLPGGASLGRALIDAWRG